MKKYIIIIIIIIIIDDYRMNMRYTNYLNPHLLAPETRMT